MEHVRKQKSKQNVSKNSPNIEYISMIYKWRKNIAVYLKFLKDNAKTSFYQRGGVKRAS